MIDFGALFGALAGSGVRYVLVGGVAATLHGSARLTQDVDIVYARDAENLARLARALAPLQPYLRGAPADRALAAGLNFTRSTTVGDIDLLGEIAGVGNYDSVISHTIEVELFGTRCRCIDLPALIEAKVAAGRPKDLETIAELRALLQERPKGA